MLSQEVKRCGGLIDYINSRPGWWSFKAEDIQVTGPDAGQPVDVPFVKTVPPFDPIPVTVVTYYPLCDCGAKVLERIEAFEEPVLLFGMEYMETCYECAVVSSD